MTSTHSGDFDQMRELLAPSVALITELAEFVFCMNAHFGFVPAEGSVAMRELNEEQRTFSKRSMWTEPIADTRSLGSATMLAAADYLRSFAILLAADQIPVFGHLVLARAGMEASVVSHWLNEPAIEPLERIRRGLTERLYSAREMYRFKPTRSLARSLLTEIKSVANVYGWTVSGRKSIATIDGRGRPSVPDALSQQLVGDAEREIGQALWSYLSGVNHVTWWALRQSVVVGPTTTSELQPPVAAFGTQSSAVFAQTVCLTRLVRIAGLTRMTLMGWASTEWVGLSARVVDFEAQLVRRFASGT